MPPAIHGKNYQIAVDQTSCVRAISGRNFCIRYIVQIRSEATMSAHILHLLSPARWDSIGAIIGDRPALEGLRDALNSALETGAGGTFVYSSDGEGYALAVALENDMHAVHTAYAREVAPVRSIRESIPMRAVPNFKAAISLAIEQRHRVLPWFRPISGSDTPVVVAQDAATNRT
jgi:hypothetical protein